MNRDSIAQQLAEGLNRIRRHPFIVSAHARSLSKDEGERWIMCAGRESASFVAILENLTSWFDNLKVREILLANLADELGNGNADEAHYMHYLQLLDRLNIPRAEFYSYKERAGIKLALSLAYNISLSRRESRALGYLLINEAMTAITYGAAKSAITNYYPNLKTDFFDLHVTVDALHVNKLYDAVDELPASSERELLFGMEIGERGMAVLLDEAYGIFDCTFDIPQPNQPSS
jgi:pyrroloquinoline quinone (PQQ) biosynthesis protein C